MGATEQTVTNWLGAHGLLLVVLAVVAVQIYDWGWESGRKARDRELSAASKAQAQS